MSIPVIAFFNNKGGVGKTSTVYHVAWMLSEKGLRVVAADLDPQANLTAAFLDDDRLEQLMDADGHSLTVFGSVQPLKEGTGDIADPHVEIVSERLGLVPGDLALSTFEDDLSALGPTSNERGSVGADREAEWADPQGGQAGPEAQGGGASARVATKLVIPA